ncbi:transketolase [Alistipes sp. ZOR0009]|uniref:transketolase n=1 Tax=Alistipes sp. ZOR0009 TaxID=1339253 RepID=UPI000690DF07|nr:transketolase [Alistipes sp. ZOR0009]
MMNTEELKLLSYNLRKKSLEVAYGAGRNGAHLGGGLSTIEIFAVLFGSIMKYDSKNPLSEERDRLVISKGHCVLAYYSALNLFGFLSDEELALFENNGAFLHGHATRSLERGIEFSGGSLGMGLPFAVGVALALKRKGSPNKVYCLVGDGECDEGSIWEALMSASHFGLNNLVVIVDKNGLQYDGKTSDVMSADSLSAKFQSFGFEVSDVDGHSTKKLVNAFCSFSNTTQPKAVIANTVKGKGVSFMENVKEWHHSVLSEAQYTAALEEIKNEYAN